MTTASTSRWPAHLCALLLLLGAFVAFPAAEIGIVDDWAYIQSARLLAQTGHIVYNGWDTPMLGWQLFLGALFAKLFGPSYTAIRFSTLLVATATAFLTQRTLVRAGITSRNATIGTISLVLSPLFLPLAVSFMTDIGGLFCVVLCLYACLRALQAHTNATVLAWLCFAALSNAAGGTVRQIAWLGVLVMFPCTVWLLRRRPRVLVTGAPLYAISFIIVFGSLHWFLHQPHAESEPLLVGISNPHQLVHLAVELLSIFLSFALFLLPILIAFIPAVSLRSRRTSTFLAVGGLFCASVYIFLAVAHPHTLVGLIAPFKGNYVTPYGILGSFSIKGYPPTVLAPLLRFLITILVLAALLCFSAFPLARPRRTFSASQPPVTGTLSWPCLLILTGPFVLAYLALLLPRGLRGDLFDRYLLLLLPIGLILLLRLFQDRVQPNLPALSYALVLLFALYAIAGTHDAFCMYRARQAAVTELLFAGIPDTAIDAGFEHNGTAQIERVGYIAGPHTRPTTAAKPSLFAVDCEPDEGWLTPAMVPGYALSYNPNACGGPSRFVPIAYRQWLRGFHTTTIYIVDTAKSAPTQP
jgi:hypothetical protein